MLADYIYSENSTIEQIRKLGLLAISSNLQADNYDGPTCLTMPGKNTVLTTINVDVPPNTGEQPNTVRPWYYVCTIHCVHVYYTYDRNVRNQLLNIIIYSRLQYIHFLL